MRQALGLPTRDSDSGGLEEDPGCVFFIFLTHSTGDVDVFGTLNPMLRNLGLRSVQGQRLWWEARKR